MLLWGTTYMSFPTKIQLAICFLYTYKLKFNFAGSYKNHPEEHGRFLRVICHNIILQLYAIILH